MKELPIGFAHLREATICKIGNAISTALLDLFKTETSAWITSLNINESQLGCKMALDVIVKPIHDTKNEEQGALPPA